MSYAVVPGKQSGAAESRAITATTTSRITCALGTFQTTFTAIGDAVEITGSASNNGIYIVVAVVSQTELDVYPALTAGGASGTAAVYAPLHELTITDEPTPTCASIASAIAALDSRLFFSPGGAADLSTDNEDWTYYFHLFQIIAFTYTSASVSTFVSKREVIASYYNRRTSAGGMAASLAVGFKMVSKAGSTGDVALQFGELGGAGSDTGRQGSILLHGGPDINFGAGKMSVQAYDTRFIGQSEWTSHYYGSNRSGVNAFLYGCQISGWNHFTGSQTLEVKHCRFSIPTWNVATLVSGFTGTLVFEDNLIGDTRSVQAFILQNCGFKRFKNFKVSDATNTPYFTYTASSVSVEDMPVDYAYQTMFAAASNCVSMKRNTYNPRIVELRNNIEAVTPLSGVRVDIEKFMDARYISITVASTGTWTLTINGVVINATGSAAIGTLQTNIINAINAAGAGVTAISGINGGQTGGATSIYVTENTVGRAFTMSLGAAGSSGTWQLAYTKLGQLNVTPDDFFEGVISGSPYTSDANGRINTSGVMLTRAIHCESTFPSRREANVKYKVTFSKTGYETLVQYVVMTAVFNGDVVMRPARMGGLR